MFLAISLFTACSKTASAPIDEPVKPVTFTLYSPSNGNFGSIQISKEQEGNAKVIVVVNKNTLSQFQPPFELKLIASTLPSATLQPINSEGISETFPVISSNKGLIVSYDALMFMRDLQLQILDAQNNVVALCDVH